MSIRDSASPRLVPTPRLPAMVKRLLFNNMRTFPPCGNLNWLLWGGIMISCMTTAWTIATSSPTEWSLACARHFHRDGRVGCSKTRLMNSAHSVSNSAFRLSEPLTRYILRLFLPCTRIKRIFRGTRVSQYNSRIAMVTLPMPHTSIHPHNNDCHLVWPTSEDVLHTIHPSSWVR